MAPYQFPDGFVWGVATAAAQIEGAARSAGKGESIWDRFATMPGKIKHGDKPEIACDHYHRYEADFDLLNELGITHYRLSIAWPRVFPAGDGPINTRGLDDYSRMIDALLSRGITPWVTLFHWDLPQPLEDRGGWLARDGGRIRALCRGCREAAGRSRAELVHRERDSLLHRQRLWQRVFCARQTRERARAEPGVSSCSAGSRSRRGGRAVSWHGRARVGLVHNHLPAPPIPVTETDADITAAREEYERTNGQLMGPVFKGEYPEAFLRQAGADAPGVEPGDMECIALPTDFLGLNIYAGNFVRAGAGGKPEVLPFPRGYPEGALWWLKITPQSLYWAVRYAAEVFGVKTFYMTESGATFDDDVTPQGEVLDLHRREYLRNYLVELHRAVSEGHDVRGFFVWSLLDNFEWAEGYEKRFGIVHVNFDTQERTPKLSSRWYSEVIRNNRIV